MINPEDVAGGYVESGTYEIKQDEKGTTYIRFNLYVFGDYDNETQNKHLTTNWLEHLTCYEDEDGYIEFEDRYFDSPEDKYGYKLACCVLDYLDY